MMLEDLAGDGDDVAGCRVAGRGEAENLMFRGYGAGTSATSVWVVMRGTSPELEKMWGLEGRTGRRWMVDR
jgi:hypothetical protein